MKRYCLDTNVILRFLLADHPSHSPEAKKLFEAAGKGSCELYISHVCLAETAWVLSSFYDFTRTNIATHLKGLLAHSGVVCDDGDVLFLACEYFGRMNVDFIDCYLAAQTTRSGGVLISFDKDYRKFSSLPVMTPGEAAKPCN